MAEVRYFLQAFYCQIPQLFFYRINGMLSRSCYCCPTGIVFMCLLSRPATLLGNETVD